MSKLLRIIVLLVIPCLVADTGVAAFPSQVTGRPGSALFAQQALSVRATPFLKWMTSQPTPKIRATQLVILAFSTAFMGVTSLSVRAQSELHEKVQTPSNLEMMKILGFTNLGGGFYFKSGWFIVKLNAEGGLENILVSLIYGGRYDPNGIKTIDLGPKDSITGDQRFRLIKPNGHYDEVTVDKRYGSYLSGQTIEGPLYTSQELASGFPLKARLQHMGAIPVAPGSNLYVIADGKTPLYILDEQEQIRFLGKLLPPDLIFPQTQILGFRQDYERPGTPLQGILRLRGSSYTYYLDSSGRIIQIQPKKDQTATTLPERINLRTSA